MIGIIAAVGNDGVIGKGGDLPWHYPADLKRFKRLTTGQVIIMGRKTWESLPKKPLPGRRNVVISKTLKALEGAECFASLPDAFRALGDESRDIWLIGGHGIFAEGLALADRLDLTYVPENVQGDNLVFFPDFSKSVWQSEGRVVHPDDARMAHEVFLRRE